MTLPESEAPDRPFPGAHSQVPGHRGALAASPDPATDEAWRPLPLQATETAVGDGWTISLPLRVEEVSLTKRVVIRERVAIRTQLVEGTQHVAATARRERLRVDTEGDPDVADERRL